MSLEIPDNTPRRFAVLLYRQREAIDVMGPLEALNSLSRNVGEDVRPFQLTIITPDGKPASTGPASGQGSLVNQQMVADCGYHYDSSKPHANLLNDVPEAEVLIVPGDIGPPSGERDGVVEFIRQYYGRHLRRHEDRYLFTVCTGSGLAAQAGCLEGVYATTNKTVWNWIPDADFAQKTYGKYLALNNIADARWVDQGNIWTTSGVSAGTDGMIAWMTKIYGKDATTAVTNGMEWNVMDDPKNDPFSKLNDCHDKPNESGLPAPG